MEVLIAYIIKVNIALIFFYLLYVIFLKKDTFFAFRRYFILVATVFSFVYPFVTVAAWGNIISFEKPQKYTTQVTVEDTAFTVVLEDEVQTAEPVNTIYINWWQVLLFILSAGVVFFLARFTWQLVSILHIKHKSIRKSIDGIGVFDLYDVITPFSFFGWIFIHLDSHSGTEIKQILLHEQTHARQWHSVDIILMELLCVFLWWNPIIWLMKRETAINLEHLADNGVLRKGVNSRDYQYYLLRLTYHQNTTRIVNNFNVSLLKQRITMMNKTKSPARKLVKYMIALPLALLLMAGNSVYAQNQRESQIFTEVEKYPEFPGGNQAFMKFLAEGIKYPVKAQENNEQGRILTNFVVEKDGSISNIKVIRGVTAALDAEAVRLLNSMPNWQSGEHQGKPARVRFTLPIVFRLQGGSPEESKSPITPVSAEANEKGKMLDEVVVVGYGPTPRKSIPSPQEFAESKDNEIFVVVEDQPEFPGGSAAMMHFIAENIRYPKEAHEKGIQGRVITKFIVRKDGSIDSVQIVRGVDPLLDAEAIRVLESMPTWKPGKQRGQPVNVMFTLPVVFRLDKNSENGIQKSQTSSKNVQNPEFPGGENAYMKFLSDNIKYPVIAQENGIQGFVDAVFNIDTKGKVTFVKFNRSVDPSLDKEVKRVIELMPDWIPGKFNGAATSITSGASFVFRLQGDGVDEYKGPIPSNAIVVVGYGSSKK
ncbi:MAG: M56 family metallopeptidase [Petrimonas sp.]|nr:M56 family metallopeptidase [Petrimonas sp.]HMM17122.1 M56 family metallopeptidase [Petrimonas sp.]